MHQKITLSYVLTTFNKLQYLQIVLDELIANCKEDEEIVVTDGGSTDGTKEFLESLYKDGKIHQFISEKDFGESHGFNKGMLLAKGEIIKIITDDDVFNYDVISNCKNYLKKNKEIDVLICNLFIVSASDEQSNPIPIHVAKNYEIWFQDWADKKTKSTFFCGIPLFIRRSSIPKLGLFDPSIKFVDFEYSIRISFNKANIAFYKPVVACAFVNPLSNSMKYKDLLQEEVERVSKYYGFEYLIGEVKNPKRDKINNFLKKIKLRYQLKKETYPSHNFFYKEIKNEKNNLQTYKSINLEIETYNNLNYFIEFNNQDKDLFIKIKK